MEPVCLLQLQRRKKGTFYCGERGRAFHPRSPRADAGPMPEAKAVGGVLGGSSGQDKEEGVLTYR